VPLSGIARTAAGAAGAAAGASAAASTTSNNTTNNSHGGLMPQYVRQRRYSSSSSKPSDGFDASGPSSSGQTHAKGVNGGAGESKREGRRSRRAGKEQRSAQQQQHDAAFSKLPSVPSTQYQQPHDVHVASFFSIHRPISVSTTVPPSSNQEAFDAIFSSKKSAKAEQEDVMLTLSSAVQSMENTAAEHNDLGRHLEVDVQPYDSMNMSDIKLSVDELAKRLRPFHPPPPPMPFDEAKEIANARQSESSPQENSYSTVLTIHESTDATGRKTYEAHTTPFVRTQDMDAPGATEHEEFIDVPQKKGSTYIERLRNNRTMHAISTKRRRKAKMKKHKYKKLLRNTRTLRRKLDKA
jgi:hypothetical protein